MLKLLLKFHRGEDEGNKGQDKDVEDEEEEKEKADTQSEEDASQQEPGNEEEEEEDNPKEEGTRTTNEDLKRIRKDTLTSLGSKGKGKK